MQSGGKSPLYTFHRFMVSRSALQARGSQDRRIAYAHSAFLRFVFRLRQSLRNDGVERSLLTRHHMLSGFRSERRRPAGN